jgi:hypothetical protein
MEHELRKTYLRLLLPALILLLLAYGAEQAGLINTCQIQVLNIIAPLVFVLSVALAVALPVFLRSLFAHRVRNQTRVSGADWVCFERRLLRVALLSPYLSLAAFLLEFPRFYFAGTLLTALYACYYFYPSRKRIAFEKRLFRVEAEETPVGR